jgi:hypothetical protein
MTITTWEGGRRIWKDKIGWIPHSKIFLHRESQFTGNVHCNPKRRDGQCSLEQQRWGKPLLAVEMELNRLIGCMSAMKRGEFS